MRARILIFFIAIGLMQPISPAQRLSHPANSEHWVSTWATAQQLMIMAPPAAFAAGRPPSTSPGADAQQSNRPPQQNNRGNGPMAAVPAALEDQTVRMIVHTSLGGHRVRVQISNALGASPLEIGSAHIAVHRKDSEIVPDTDRAITFGGKASCTIPPGVLFVSDPVNMEFPPLADLAVSLYLPRNTGAPATHRLGLHTAYISKGDVTGQEAMPQPSTAFAYLWLSSVDVLAPADAFTVVALGDSITDGYATTPDANRSWPALLAKRFISNKGTQRVAVVNQGISGNQVLRDGAGLSALARFDRDVLSLAGVKWVILLEGINDINIRGRTDGPNALTSDDLIAGYRQIIERAHTHGIKVIGATLTPEEGVPTASERGEEIRLTANQWIRTKGNFDAVVDFDAVIRDPARPIRMRQELDPGDHIHPNDKGNQAMADAFDLAVFKK
jgi:lysophospholipase L1-like esterase